MLVTTVLANGYFTNSCNEPKPRLDSRVPSPGRQQKLQSQARLTARVLSHCNFFGLKKLLKFTIKKYVGGWNKSVQPIVSHQPPFDLFLLGFLVRWFTKFPSKKETRRRETNAPASLAQHYR